MMFDNLPQDVKCNDLQLVINRENGMLLHEAHNKKSIWKGMIQRGFYHEENSLVSVIITGSFVRKDG